MTLGIREPMKLFCDNKAAISIAHNRVQYDRTNILKSICTSLKRCLILGLSTPYIHTKLQLADLFTKGIARLSCKFMASKLSMQDIFEPT